jgi:hypothetical protein
MNNSRRNFMKTIALGAGVLIASPILKLKSVFADLANANDPLVKALGYVPNAKDAKDRKDKKANCSNCQFYGDATGKANQAKCQLIASGEVMGAGWCRSYSKRAQAANKA